MSLARSPKFNHLGTIDLILNHPICGEIPFTASPDDPYSADLYALALAGEFGIISECDPLPVPKRTTSLEFMDRFTDDEQITIVSATMSSPSVKLWYDKLIAATEVRYSDSRLIAGMQALVTAGLITQARMDAILPEAWR